MTIIYEDEYFFAIDKPPGYFVHPPERSPYPVPREKILIYHLRRLMNHDVYPVHRLDAGTTGVLLFARNRDAAGVLGKLFMQREIEKNYEAVVRGYVAPEGVIEIPLEVDASGTTTDAKTLYSCKAQLELPVAVTKKYPTSRYSLVKVQPVTGRWHQIRRHFDRIAHPLIGDIVHGDSYHNRFFRDELKIPGLCLRATELNFIHPWLQGSIEIKAPPCERWGQLEKLFNI